MAPVGVCLRSSALEPFNTLNGFGCFSQPFIAVGVFVAAFLNVDVLRAAAAQPSGARPGFHIHPSNLS